MAWKIGARGVFDKIIGINYPYCRSDVVAIAIVASRHRIKSLCFGKGFFVLIDQPAANCWFSLLTPYLHSATIKPSCSSKAGRENPFAPANNRHFCQWLFYARYFAWR
ncbi:hypothetical protein KEF85_01545 [Methylomonas paludis]|uniref:Uncharacterized protein n=1 Tax=Methylomonas paludis TaxID=1173101 RepID=A0A975MKU2_9GAMM|nr:hypothetical protein [Methylomonas paludis]QWF69661.1 hypothetical protein KEF85_09755 [Methylomonas paludis]QWF71208.1 hypothetical protein KEF85_01545 [Methylomonas paludis]